MSPLDDLIALLDPERREWVSKLPQVEFSELFEALRPGLAGRGGSSFATLADRLEMTEGAVRTAMSRLRSKYRDRLRREIAQTVDDTESVDDEIRHLLDSL